ncbi:MAG: hypothetical protein ACLU5I_03645 [Alistipes finegoldii]
MAVTLDNVSGVWSVIQKIRLDIWQSPPPTPGRNVPQKRTMPSR